MSQVQLTENNAISKSTFETSSGPLLQVENLSVTFSKEFGFLGRQTRTTKAVDRVSFNLYPSETLSLVGESGSGKTTIARCITALAAPTSGSIKYNGMNVTKLSGKNLINYRREVQIAFQDPFGSLNPFDDVFSAIATPIRRLNRESGPQVIQSVSSLLEEVGLVPSEVMHKLPHQLSGGERQRVNIARALASRPRILVADEPVSMLDASQRLNLLLLLQELQERRKIAVLMITHDLATSKVMGGRTAVMYLGKLVEIGPTLELLATPHHPYTELLISAAPRMNFESEDALGNIAKPFSTTIEESEKLQGGCVFRNRCPYATQICSDEEPELLEKSNNRFTACHNWINK
jgi:peptide/nickel transport system ATP-binding protein